MLTSASCRERGRVPSLHQNPREVRDALRLTRDLTPHQHRRDCDDLHEAMRLEAPTVRPGGSAGSFSSASSTPGTNASREIVSWRIVSSWPVAAEQHLLVRDEPGQPHRVDRRLAADAARRSPSPCPTARPSSPRRAARRSRRAAGAAPPRRRSASSARRRSRSSARRRAADRARAPASPSVAGSQPRRADDARDARLERGAHVRRRPRPGA